LRDIFYFLGGSKWKNQSGWEAAASGNATDYCTLYGVYNFRGCQPVLRGRLLHATSTDSPAPSSEIDLSNNGLSGPLPSSLGSLTTLTALRLGGNGITGSIPESLSSLASLSTLDLRGNMLTGSVPVTLASLSQLLFIDLSGNQLNGARPLRVSDVGATLTSVGVRPPQAPFP